MEEDPKYRKIVHIDMDAFYASVEQLDHPELKGKPIAVGGSKERGVVAAASYEARKFGVKSAMSSKIAVKKCPQLIFVKPRFERYKEISQKIRSIFLSYTDLVEPLSLDEAFLDVSQNKKGIKTATEIAQMIRDEIKSTTGLTASAGVSINKFVSKVASDFQKPDGLTVIKPKKVEAFIQQLPIRKFFGVGEATEKKMHSYGILKGKDLLKFSENELRQMFGKQGRFYYQIARGIDLRPVNPNRERKSIGAEKTFEKDLSSQDSILEMMMPIAEKTWKRYKTQEVLALTLTLKVKYEDFEQFTKSKTLQQPFEKVIDFYSTIQEMCHEIPLNKKVRLLGCTLSNFLNHKPEGLQLTLQF